MTSRAAQWVDETDAPLKDVTVCFYDGTAEARARAEMPVLADVPLLGGAFEADVRILGRIETEGGVARVTITEIDAGDIPDWATGPVEDDLEEIVNSRLDDYDVGHTYTVTYRERQIEIVGTP